MMRLTSEVNLCTGNVSNMWYQDRCHTYIGGGTISFSAKKLKARCNEIFSIPLDRNMLPRLPVSPSHRLGSPTRLDQRVGSGPKQEGLLGTFPKSRTTWR